MSKKIMQVMIRTSIPWSHEQFTEIASKMKTLDGVIKFDRNTRIPRVISVAFDAGKIRTLTLINKLTRLGFNASLVSF